MQPTATTIPLFYKILLSSSQVHPHLHPLHLLCIHCIKLQSIFFCLQIFLAVYFEPPKIWSHFQQKHIKLLATENAGPLSYFQQFFSLTVETTWPPEVKKTLAPA
jgi:hypothetical protein